MARELAAAVALAPQYAGIAAAVFLCAVFAIDWLRARATKRKRRKWASNYREIDKLRVMCPYDFERLVAAAYERQGYKATITGGGGADGGLDVMLEKRGRKKVVQCKRYAGKVRAPVVRELYGVMFDKEAQGAVIVGLSGFTRDATSWAKGKPIELVDGAAVLKLLKEEKSAPSSGAGAAKNSR